eukprot:m.23580 g.23580  ORF g.23580 m.23580 type:complete len:195 (+) comp9516_c0_seq1:140-724(+)
MFLLTLTPMSSADFKLTACYCTYFFFLSSAQIHNVSDTRILRMRIRRGSCDRRNKVFFGLFSPEEARHHLMEGALGPEYQLASTMHQHGPRRLVAHVAFRHSYSWSYDPPSKHLKLLEELAVPHDPDSNEALYSQPTAREAANKSSLTKTTSSTAPPAETEVTTTHIWEFEADIHGDDLVAWQVRNMNNIIFTI